METDSPARKAEVLGSGVDIFTRSARRAPLLLPSATRTHREPRRTLHEEFADETPTTDARRACTLTPCNVIMGPLCPLP